MKAAAEDVCLGKKRWEAGPVVPNEQILLGKFARRKSELGSQQHLKMTPEAEELLESAAMKPYMKLALAVMGHKDVGPAVEEITALSLEKRYTWRVASALKWGFADFENLNVVADRRTLCQEDLDTLVDLLKVRPLQFCMFLAALFGEEQMEKLISSSVQQVKTIRANRRKSLGREPELGEE